MLNDNCYMIKILHKYRKRKGGIKLENDDDGEEEESETEDFNEQEHLEQEMKKQEKEEASKKARIEDLWASFKSDTAHVRAKPSCSQTTSSKVISNLFTVFDLL